MLRYCAIALAAVLVAGCNKTGVDSPDVKKREAEVKQRIAAAAGSESADPVAKWILPDVLREISGIAMTKDGRILAHNETRRVYVIDPLKGVVRRAFPSGTRAYRDFEPSRSQATILSPDKNGDIYEFREGDENEVVPFTKHVTGSVNNASSSRSKSSRKHGPLSRLQNHSRKSERNQLLLFAAQQTEARESYGISVPLAEAIGQTT